MSRFNHGGLHLSYAEDGPYQLGPPRTFPACKAATLVGRDGCVPVEPEEDYHKVACESGSFVSASVDARFSRLGWGQYASTRLRG